MLEYLRVETYSSNPDCCPHEERYVDIVQDAMVVTGSEFLRP